MWASKTTVLVSILWLVQKSAAVFVHPGLLHTETDFQRITSKLVAQQRPWLTGWEKLTSSPKAQANYTPQPAQVVYRGYDGKNRENYGQLYRDVSAAYALAIRWKITNDIKYANAAVRILDAWSSTLTKLAGTNDRFLAAGIYGYQFAQSAELMRSYAGWARFRQFCDMITKVFYATVNEWLTGQATAKRALAFYANWDLCNVAAAIAIGILLDDEAVYRQGVDYFLNGPGNGHILKAVPYVHTVTDPLYGTEFLGQTMEAGRDQGHTMLDIAHFGVIGQMTYNQGSNLFIHNNSLIFTAAEYAAKYNLGFDVPYKPFNNGFRELPVISSQGRGNVRPIWELLYNHYRIRENLTAHWTGYYRDYVVLLGGGAEGGGGDYGPNSGGYDQLGWGTLLYTL